MTQTQTNPDLVLKVFNAVTLQDHHVGCGYDRMVAFTEIPEHSPEDHWRAGHALDYFYERTGILGLNTFYRWLSIFHPGMTVDVHTNYRFRPYKHLI